MSSSLWVFLSLSFCACRSNAADPVALKADSDMGKKILKWHNDARGLVKAGDAYYDWEGKKEKQPKATEMNDLVWSETLASQAAEYAATCPFPAHSKFEDRNSGGENLGWSSLKKPSVKMMKSIFQERFMNGERKRFSYDNGCTVAIENGKQKQCGHYVQVITAKATSVGCGYAVCSEGKYAGTHIVCRYDYPVFSNENPYEKAMTAARTILHDDYRTNDHADDVGMDFGLTVVAVMSVLTLQCLVCALGLCVGFLSGVCAYRANWMATPFKQTLQNPEHEYDALQVQNNDHENV